MSIKLATTVGHVLLTLTWKRVYGLTTLFFFVSSYLTSKGPKHMATVVFFECCLFVGERFGSRQNVKLFKGVLCVVKVDHSVVEDTLRQDRGRG